MKALLREIGKGFRTSVEVNKAFFAEWWMELPFGIGNILTDISERDAKRKGYEEIKVPPGIFGDWANIRAPEVGWLKSEFGRNYIIAYSKKGFYVEKGKKSEAVAFLKSVGLPVE